MSVVDSDTAMRSGLRRQLADLADERERVAAHLAYIERTIVATLARLAEVGR